MCLKPTVYSLMNIVLDIELAILLKHATKDATDSIHTTQVQLKWYNCLHSYVKSMESTKRIHINTITGELPNSL